jgi:hypothetical protein
MKMKKGIYLIVLSLLLMLSAAGMALGEAFGSKVASTDADKGDFLSPLGMGGFVYFDADISGSYSANDPVYLLPANPIAIRLTRFCNTVFPGRQLVFGNPDYLMPLLPLPAAALVYLPIYGDGATYHPDDPVYLVGDTTAVPAGHLRTNDIRIGCGNPNGMPGSKVADFSADNGMLYRLMPPEWTLQYDDVAITGTYSIGDDIYLHRGAAPFVIPGDIRLTEVP